MRLQAAGVEKNTTPLLIFAASAVDGDLEAEVSSAP